MQIVQVQFMQLILLFLSLLLLLLDATTTSIVVCTRASAKPNNMFIFQFSAVLFFCSSILLHLMVLQGFKKHFLYYCYCTWFESPDSIIPILCIIQYLFSLQFPPYYFYYQIIGIIAMGCWQPNDTHQEFILFFLQYEWASHTTKSHYHLSIS